MYKRSFRIACILLAIFIAFCFPAQAILTELVIGGIALSSADLAVSALILGLAGAGLTDALRSAAADNDQTVKEFVGTKLAQFVSATGSAADTVYDFICSGLKYTGDGLVVFSQSVSDWVYDFGQWFSDDSLSPYLDISTSVEPPANIDSLFSGYTYDGIFASNSAFKNDNIGYSIVLSSSSPVYFGFMPVITNYAGLVACSLSPFTYTNSTNPSSSFSCTECTINGFTYYVSSAPSLQYSLPASFYPSLSYVYNNSSLNYYASFWGYCVLFGTWTGSTNGLDVWNQDGATDGYTVDPTGVIGDAIGDVPAGAAVNIGDYISALADAIAGVADVSVPIAGVGDLPIAIPDAAALDIPVNPAIPDELVDAVPVTGEEDKPLPVPGTDDYTLVLADFFPFCIPFDIYKFLSLLSASAEAPSFEWRFYVPGICDETISIDLSTFDSVAAVLRSMELLAFCVGLGFATKKLIQGA